MDDTNVVEPAVKDEDKATEAKTAKSKATKPVATKKAEKPAEVTDTAKEDVTKTPAPAKSVKDEKPSDSKPAEAAKKVDETKTKPDEGTNEPETATLKTKEAAEEHAKEEAKEQAKEQAKEHAEEDLVYPFSLTLIKPVATYRGASVELMGKPFGGKITVLGCTSNGFYKVRFVRSSVGTTVSYMLRQEVERCRS